MYLFSDAFFVFVHIFYVHYRKLFLLLWAGIAQSV
jgi:hypothetical protein